MHGILPLLHPMNPKMIRGEVRHIVRLLWALPARDGLSKAPKRVHKIPKGVSSGNQLTSKGLDSAPTPNPQPTTCKQPCLVHTSPYLVFGFM